MRKLSQFKRWLQRRETLVVNVVGCGIVSVWTVLRHSTNGINFDVIGQVGLADQWARGMQSGAELGATNYVLKMPLYAFANLFDIIPPKTRLVLLALVFNLVLFMGLFWLFRTILHLYGVRSTRLLNLGMLWLALLSGRVFWVDYANSRNLEVVGGFAVLYVTLLAWRAPTWRRCMLLAAVGTATFFADPLQLYLVGLPLFAWSIARYIQTRRMGYVSSAGALLGAIAGSKALFWLAGIWLPLTFLSPPRQQIALSIDNLVQSMQSVALSTARIFDINIFTKAFGANTLRQLCGLALLLGAVFVVVRFAPKKPTRELRWLLFGLIGWSYAVYVFSGNALTPLTERYLILVPLYVILLFAIQASTIPRKYETSGRHLWFSLVTISAVMLAGALALNWPSRFRTDAPMLAAADYARSHPGTVIVTSRQLALPANYYAGYDFTLVPTICTPEHRLVASNLFYDKAGYGDRNIAGKPVALLVPGEGVRSGTFICTSEDILVQFGATHRSEPLPNAGQLYYYAPQDFWKHLPRP